MAAKRSSGSRQHALTCELFEALGSSLDITVVLERAYPLLTRLVPADYGALGVSSTGRPEDYTWTVANVPSAFFVAYPEMAAHDFVRRAVAERPNLVLRDEDMVCRSELEGNLMYRRAREVGAPLEQVMAVMLHVDDRWQSGLSLYRDRRRPFSSRERAALQRVTPALANAVRNCHLFEAATDWNHALEQALAAGAGAILVSANGTQLACSADAAQLVDKWFAREGRRGSALPRALACLLEQRNASQESARAAGEWRKQGVDSALEVSVLPWERQFGGGKWLLLLKEKSTSIALPSAWRGLLTEKQQQVVGGVLRGWDNRLIASEVGCSSATVKKHMQNIFDRLGLDRRAAIVTRALAAERGRGSDS
jgi:DNA-binding NarL/FixJ family response regulator